MKNGEKIAILCHIFSVYSHFSGLNPTFNPYSRLFSSRNMS